MLQHYTQQVNQWNRIDILEIKLMHTPEIVG